MHKEASKSSIKQAYPKQANPPQVHKVVSKSVMEIMNWKNHLGKLKSDGMKNHTCFSQEKIMEDVWDKKIVNLTQSSFSIFLKTLKKQAIKQKKQKKQKGAQEARNKVYLIPKAFPSAT